MVIERRHRFPYLDASGALSIPLLLALLAVTFTGFGIWALERHWRFLTTDQLRIDACVGRTASSLKDTVESLERANRIIKILRISMLAAIAAEKNPAAVALIDKALRVQELRQNLLLKAWSASQTKWLLKRGCDGEADQPLPLPPLDLVRPPEDGLGPNALAWVPTKPAEFVIRLSHHPRSAAAGVMQKEFKNEGWQTVWYPPLGFKRPNIY